MKLVHCTFEQHAMAILGILNEAIENSTAIYDYKTRTPDSMVDWFKSKQLNQYPIIGLESEAGELLGFASYGPSRPWPAYKYTVEHSVYVHHGQRGRGLGKRLLEEIISLAQGQEVHVLVGGIDTSNGGSIALHRKLGFVHAGTIKQAGFKFGRWLDLAFYQRILKTPREPVDG
jgi:phosphinothricin acetyltransferase